MRSFRGALIVIAAVMLAAGCVTPPPPEVMPPPEPVPPPVPVEPPPVVEVPPEPVLREVVIAYTGNRMGKDELPYALLKSYAESADLLLLIDAGNTIAGTDFALIDEGRGVITIMSETGYHAFIPGSHDFSYDALRLEELSKIASFPFISSNIRGADFIMPVYTWEIDEITIGVFAVSSQDIFSSLHEDLYAGLSLDGYLASVSRAFELLGEQEADVIIGITDIGLLALDLPAEQLQQLQQELSPADLIIDTGYTDDVREIREFPYGYLVSDPGGPDRLAEITISLEDFTVTGMRYQSLTEEQMLRQGLQPSRFIESLIQAVLEEHQYIISRARSYIDDTGINEADRFGITPLMNALQYDEPPEIIRILLEEGAAVERKDLYGTTPLMYAAWINTHPRVISILLREGADPRIEDEEGWNALMRGVLNENPRVITFLLERGADVNAVNSEGWTALMYAAGFSSTPEAVDILIEAGAGVNMQNEEGLTALMYAAGFTQDEQIIVRLLEAGADASMRDVTGASAYDYAARNRSLSGSQVLEELRKASLEHQQ